ncbi:MAG: hypothetical protein HFI91_14945 [Lachnospiraceae bacterium]|nr:hypothetical protein [Lachnospiraceae bacterium]
MAVEITSNYSNYAANYSSTMRKADSNSAEAVKKNTSANSKDKVQEYYEKLCKKFSDITFHTGSGLMRGNENKAVINLSSQCLEKMANDPEFAKKVEFNLSGVVQGQKHMFAQAKADNAVIHGVTAVMDADGNLSVACSSMTRTSGTKQSSSAMNTEKKQKERLEKKREERRTLEEKAVKKRAEKRAEEKRVAKRRAEKKATAEERFETGEYTVNITGPGIKTVSGAIAAPAASFEAKA